MGSLLYQYFGAVAVPRTVLHTGRQAQTNGTQRSAADPDGVWVSREQIPAGRVFRDRDQEQRHGPELRLRREGTLKRVAGRMEGEVPFECG